MYGKGQLGFVPGKLSEEDTLLEVSEAERLGQGGGGREKRRPQHHSEDASRLLFLFGVCIRCAVSGSWQEDAWGSPGDPTMTYDSDFYCLL